MKRAIVIIGAVLVLSGCAATSGPGADPSSPVASQPSDSSSTTPSAAPTKPALAEIVATANGIGDIRIGSPVPTADPSFAIAAWDASACVSAGLSVGDPYAGLWAAAYPTVGGHGEDAFDLVTVDGTRDAAVGYVAIRAPSSVRTDTGIHVGDTLAALMAAYPAGFYQTRKGPNGADVYAAGSASGVIAFDVSAPYPDNASGWATDQLDRVIGINIYVPGDEVFPSYGTTNAGLCPD